MFARLLRPWIQAGKVAYLEAECRQMREDRDYWKDKAERLLDNALLRKGEVSEPVFKKAAARPESSPFGGVLKGLNIHEIESVKPAAPVVPMK